jgi:hypothetical protein
VADGTPFGSGGVRHVRKDTLTLMTRLLAYAWASPNTLLGIILALFSMQGPRVVSGVLVFDQDPPRGFLWLLQKLFRKAAITFGHVVLSATALRGRLLAHEIHHVRQYERLGPLYIPIYLLAWVFMGYRRHPFERAAQLAEIEEPAS